MKAIKYFFIILTLLLTSFNTQQSQVYENLGEFNYDFDENTNVGLSAYVIKEININKNFNYKNVFILKLRSTSHNKGELTATWIYGAKVVINGNDITEETSPNGITVYINTTETTVYSWYTNAEDLSYGITWSDAVYDPRDIK